MQESKVDVWLFWDILKIILSNINIWKKISFEIHD